MVSYIIISVVCAVLLAADQVTKAVIDSNLQVNGKEISVIDNFFSIANVHNTGAAWGMLGNATVFLAILSIIMAAAVLFVYVQVKPALLKLSTALIFVGAIGNVIDRIRLGYVVDFLHFYNLFGFYNFPCFNVADICVTSGVIGLAIFMIFYASKKKAFRDGTVLSRYFDRNREKKNANEAAASKKQSAGGFDESYDGEEMTWDADAPVRDETDDLPDTDAGDDV
ncbi:MAG: signal peptidase II [Clostridia bacterium]|nr:signal peptidase II [Clostridia bacterium]